MMLGVYFLFLCTIKLSQDKVTRQALKVENEVKALMVAAGYIFVKVAARTAQCLIF